MRGILLPPAVAPRLVCAMHLTTLTITLRKELLSDLLVLLEAQPDSPPSHLLASVTRERACGSI